MNRLRLTLTALLALVVTSLSSPAFAQAPQTIGNYEKVSETRITRTVSRFVYRATLQNNGPALSSATATATSLVPSTTIVDGNLAFGPVPQGGSVSSGADTFSFDQDRSVPFDWNNIQWAITPTYAPSTPAVE